MRRPPGEGTTAGVVAALALIVIFAAATLYLLNIAIP